MPSHEHLRRQEHINNCACALRATMLVGRQQTSTAAVISGNWAANIYALFVTCKQRGYRAVSDIISKSLNALHEETTVHSGVAHLPASEGFLPVTCLMRSIIKRTSSSSSSGHTRPSMYLHVRTSGNYDTLKKLPFAQPCDASAPPRSLIASPC